MARSDAATPEQYLAELPDDRRATLAAVRDLVNDNLPDGFRESMEFGMIAWGIPLERYPDTYNGRPLGYIALAAQKNYNALHLMGVYGRPEAEDRLRQAFDDAGKKMDMGKSCLRFRSLDDLPLDAIADLVASTSPDEMIAHYEQARGA